MLGDRSTNMPGLAVLTVKDITEHIKYDTEKDFSITISYVEIYNEAIRDLLVPSSSYLDLRDDPIKVLHKQKVIYFRVLRLQVLLNFM